MDTAGPLAREVSRRKVITLAAAAALGAGLAPGTFRVQQLKSIPPQLATFTPLDGEFTVLG